MQLKDENLNYLENGTDFFSLEKCCNVKKLLHVGTSNLESVSKTVWVIADDMKNSKIL